MVAESDRLDERDPIPEVPLALEEVAPMCLARIAGADVFLDDAQMRAYVVQRAAEGCPVAGRVLRVLKAQAPIGFLEAVLALEAPVGGRGALLPPARHALECYTDLAAWDWVASLDTVGTQPPRVVLELEKLFSLTLALLIANALDILGEASQLTGIDLHDRLAHLRAEDFRRQHLGPVSATGRSEAEGLLALRQWRQSGIRVVGVAEERIAETLGDLIARSRVRLEESLNGALQGIGSDRRKRLISQFSERPALDRFHGDESLPLVAPRRGLVID